MNTTYLITWILPIRHMTSNSFLPNFYMIKFRKMKQCQSGANLHDHLFVVTSGNWQDESVDGRRSRKYAQ